MTLLLQIPKRSSCCAHGKEPFKEGMEYYSFIQHEKDNIYVRLDYCQNCWEEMKLPEKTFWKGKIQRKIDNILKSAEESAMLYLEEILSHQDKKAEAFILALYLVRKKLLAFRKSIEEFDLYEKLETEKMLAIPKILISQLDLVLLQKNLAEKLGPNGVP